MSSSCAIFLVREGRMLPHTDLLVFRKCCTWEANVRQPENATWCGEAGCQDTGKWLAIHRMMMKQSRQPETHKTHFRLPMLFH